MHLSYKLRPSPTVHLIILTIFRTQCELPSCWSCSVLSPPTPWQIWTPNARHSPTISKPSCTGVTQDPQPYKSVISLYRAQLEKLCALNTLM